MSDLHSASLGQGGLVSTQLIRHVSKYTKTGDHYEHYPSFSRHYSRYKLKQFNPKYVQYLTL